MNINYSWFFGKYFMFCFLEDLCLLKGNNFNDKIKDNFFLSVIYFFIYFRERLQNWKTNQTHAEKQLPFLQPIIIRHVAFSNWISFTSTLSNLLLLGDWWIYIADETERRQKTNLLSQQWLIVSLSFSYYLSS